MKTLKVRIAVAIDFDGNWSASGWDKGGDDQLMDIAAEGVDVGETRYWITAVLPIPEIQEVQKIEGEVTDA